MSNRVKSLWKRRTFRLTLIGLLVLITVAVAFASSVPHTFTAGTAAKASEVNDNFSYLADRSWDKSGPSLFYNGGNVGIGNSSPSAPLHISSASPNYGVIIEGLSGMAPTIGFRPKDTGSQNWSTGASNVGWYVHNASVDDYKLVVDNSGKVGIGVLHPSNPLHMASGAHVSAGGVWTNASSRAYKENIAKLDSDKAMAALKALEPVTYTYKADKAEQHVGFIAEDAPALVATKDRKGMSPMDVAAVLTKVVQEQQKQIARLESELAAVKKKM